MRIICDPVRLCVRREGLWGLNCGMSKAKNSNGYLGVTEPISLSGPTEKDLKQTAEVEKVVFYISDKPKPPPYFVLFSLDSCHFLTAWFCLCWSVPFRCRPVWEPRGGCLARRGFRQAGPGWTISLGVLVLISFPQAYTDLKIFNVVADCESVD